MLSTQNNMLSTQNNMLLSQTSLGELKCHMFKFDSNNEEYGTHIPQTHYPQYPPPQQTHPQQTHYPQYPPPQQTHYQHPQFTLKIKIT